MQRLIRFNGYLFLIGMVLLTSCNFSKTPPAPTDTTSPNNLKDSVLFYNGQVITMKDDQPQAEAVLVQGDTILAVGSEADVMSHAGSDTIKIDLGGRTLVPGFIDSHVHRIGDRGMGGFDSADASIQLAIEQGYTTMNEMFVDQGRLDELRNLDQAGALRLRVNAYLPLNYNEPKFGNWYQAYQPGHEYSPYLRIAGLKIFMDHGWGKGELLWTQDELDRTLIEASDLGWQIAAHTVGEPAHTEFLNTVERIEQADPGRDYRFRIEHVIVISDADIQRMVDLNVLASIQLPGPNAWAVAFDDFDPNVTPDLYPHFARYRDLMDAGVFIVGSSDWPWGKVDDDYGYPMKMLNQAVTRIGPGGIPPQDWMVGQEIPIELAFRSLTINGAYAAFQEDIKGSIEPGKFADLVILSANPLETSIEDVPNIKVLMTMIGGKVEWCASGFEALCPAEGQAPPTNNGSVPVGFIDTPIADTTVFGNVNISGWALDDNGTIDHIEIHIDGKYLANAAYGSIPRPDVANDYPGRQGEPNFGFIYSWDTTQFKNGEHTLSVIAVNSSGIQSEIYPGEINLTVQN